MLAELFYPKELKDAIKKLRAENDLNEKVLKSLNRSSYLILIFTVLMSYIWLLWEFLYPNKGLEAPLIFCLMSSLYYPFNTYFAWKNCMAAYIHGKRNEGIIKAVRYILYGGVHIKVYNEVEEKTHSISSAYPRHFFKSYKLPSKGDKLEYYYLDKEGYKGNPIIEVLMEHNCLKKSLIEDNNKC